MVDASPGKPLKAGPSSRIDPDDIQQIGARLTFVEGEWLPSMFRRIGHSLDASADDIARWCGLHKINVVARRRLGSKLSSNASGGIQAGLGFTAEQLRTTAMESLPADLVNLRPDGSPSQSKDWTRGTGTRYCVECLLERPGVFYTHWRLWWSFICWKHHVVLRSTCSLCRNEIVEAKMTERSCRDPSLCWAKRPDDTFCLQPLTETWREEPLDPASPMVLAQLSLARAWTEEIAGIPDISNRTFRGTAIALLAADDVGRIASLARIPETELRGLFDEPEPVGMTPPREPLAMAALLGAAYELITDAESNVRETIRQVTFSRPVRGADVVAGPGSARYLLSFWPGVDARMRGRVLRSIDKDLPTIQRLVHGSAASKKASDNFEFLRESWTLQGFPHQLFQVVLNAPDSRSNGNWANRAVPRLLWPSWAAPLGVDDRTESNALQTALSDALRIAGTGALPDPDEIAGIGKRLRPSMFGTDGQTDSVLRQLCDLTLVLRASPGPINYGLRLRMPIYQLLMDEHWNLLSASVGEAPGKNRRLLNARRYAFLRMSAAAPRDLPPPLRFRPTVKDDIADHTKFIITMSAEMKIAIDQYLVGWLCRFEHLVDTDAPQPLTVAWEPARFVHPGADLAPELDDINLAVLHEHIGNGETALGRLAKIVDRTPRHVRWAIAAHPLPSGTLITPIDWTTEWGVLTDRVETWVPDEFLPRPDVAWMKRLDL
ncbi:TniQ family protein [Cryobacterium sp. 10I5]|uniref:TniQ family protein n=1 Tax=Cryobacterium sp. 10I5 TaxID=3048581 RepID=UPI002B23152A|nr:TniQ family protein [Cryobacterium sp. 10I5]MEB0265066.1 TniQ family protein [Cryobacterium sp. 10I5]